MKHCKSCKKKFARKNSDKKRKITKKNYSRKTRKYIKKNNGGNGSKNGDDKTDSDDSLNSDDEIFYKDIRRYQKYLDEKKREEELKKGIVHKKLFGEGREIRINDKQYEANLNAKISAAEAKDAYREPLVLSREEWYN
jgi:hypothetical protein